MQQLTQIIISAWRESSKTSNFEQTVQLLSRQCHSTIPFLTLDAQKLDFKVPALLTILDDSPLPTLSLNRQQRLQELILWSKQEAPLPEWLTLHAGKNSGIFPLHLKGELLGVFLIHFKNTPLDQITVQSFGKALQEPLSLALHRSLQKLSDPQSATNKPPLLHTSMAQSSPSNTIIGTQKGLLEVMKRVEMVAKSDVPVLLLGETGTGKEVVSRNIHENSSRATAPFLRVNCGAIPPELIDSELFGHERGSFTGASQKRLGWFERANSGTLLLDEVGELTPAAQVRLLRVLQDGTFERVGGQKQLQVSIRIIAATNANMEALVNKGYFRADLWYRLAVFPIILPPLRDRPEDIADLAVHFATKAADKFGLPMQLPTNSDISLLLSYEWPGNIREFASVIDRAAILGDGHGLQIRTALGVPLRHQMLQESQQPLFHEPTLPATTPHMSQTTRIDNHDMHTSPQRSAVTPENIQTLEAVIREHIIKALTLTNGVIEGQHGAAKMLNINPNTLRSRMRRMGIKRSSHASFS